MKKAAILGVVLFCTSCTRKEERWPTRFTILHTSVSNVTKGPCEHLQYAITECGVHDQQQFQDVQSDPVVHTHYASVEIDHTEILPLGTELWTSYRKGNSILWKKVTLRRTTEAWVDPSGRPALKVGCGNRLSLTQQGQTEPNPPKDEDLEESEPVDGFVARLAAPLVSSVDNIATPPSQGLPLPATVPEMQLSSVAAPLLANSSAVPCCICGIGGVSFPGVPGFIAGAIVPSVLAAPIVAEVVTPEPGTFKGMMVLLTMLAVVEWLRRKRFWKW